MRTDTRRLTEVAQAWGRAYGYRAAPGGWVHDATGRAVVRGWVAFAFRFRERILADVPGIPADVREHLRRWAGPRGY